MSQEYFTVQLSIFISLILFDAVNHVEVLTSDECVHVVEGAAALGGVGDGHTDEGDVAVRRFPARHRPLPLPGPRAARSDISVLVLVDIIRCVKGLVF